MVRLFQILIVLSWLGTTTWLAWTVWSPSGSGFTEMEEEEALSAFFNWNESDSFSILDAGRRIGQATVSASQAKDRQGGDHIVRSFSATGSLYDDERFRDDPNAITVSWRVSMEFDTAVPMNLDSAQVTFRVPKQNINLILDLENKEQLLRVRAKVEEATIFEYKGNPSEMPEMPSVLSSGLTSGFLGDMGDLKSSLQPEVIARRGTKTFGGRDLPVFLIEIKPSPEKSGIRIYLTQAGEPIKVETDFGIEAISDVLAPLESYNGRDEKEQ